MMSIELVRDGEEYRGTYLSGSVQPDSIERALFTTAKDVFSDDKQRILRISQILRKIWHCMYLFVY